MLARLIPDRFILILLGTIALASVLPVRGGQVAVANIAASVAVFIIFFLHGIKLSRAQVIAALTNWRVHLALSLFIFGVMPLAGLGLSRLLDNWMAPLLAIGVLYIGVLPTTVQSATTYTSLAHGNTAISVVASALNNLAAIIVTPLLFAFLAGRGSGVSLSGDLGIKIAMILLLPFFIGQMLQRWLKPWVMRNPSVVRFFDQGSIAVAVYVAFSAAVVDGIWSKVPAGDFAIVALAVVLMLAIGFGGAWAMGGLLQLNRADRIATLFAGAHKSIAVGAPMAALLFPAGAAGMVLLPILLYHLLQLMISAWLTPVLARGYTPDDTAA
jgi:sodium/bile acid cotransporter 7